MTAGQPDAARRAIRPQHRHRRLPPAASAGPEGAGHPLAVRLEVRLVAGDAGQALAAAQGRALTALLASLGDVEVGQREEVSP